MIYISLIFEDTLSEMIMIRLLSDFQGKYEIYQSYSGHGYGYLKNNIKGFIRLVFIPLILCLLISIVMSAHWH